MRTVTDHPTLGRLDDDGTRVDGVVDEIFPITSDRDFEGLDVESAVEDLAVGRFAATLDLQAGACGRECAEQVLREDDEWGPVPSRHAGHTVGTALRIFLRGGLRSRTLLHLVLHLRLSGDGKLVHEKTSAGPLDGNFETVLRHAMPPGDLVVLGMHRNGAGTTI